MHPNKQDSLLVGFGVAAVVAMAYYSLQFLGDYLTRASKQLRKKTPKETKDVIALIGDVGGTNIRYQLRRMSHSYQGSILLKTKMSKVVDYQRFLDSIEHFLQGEDLRPSICVIAIAGPVNDNSVLMSQVTRWGKLEGKTLAAIMQVDHFVFLNDFQANAYALTDLSPSGLIKLNGLSPVANKPKLIIGPGTGLGTATLMTCPTTGTPFVVPGQGGHRGFAPSNDIQIEYQKYFKENSTTIAVSQAHFCGPALPHIFRFFAKKYPQHQQSKFHYSGEEVVNNAKINGDSLCRTALQLFLDMYENSVGDQILMKLPYGGVYLQGSINESVLPFLNREQGFLERYTLERPYLKCIFDRVPILFVRELDLGLRGSFMYINKLIG